jgi:predicted site-specific integrase-resolvase
MGGRRHRKTSELPELVGVREACAILGVNRMTFLRWRDSGYFDIAPREINDRDVVWTKDDIERFAADKGRQRAPIGAAAA